MRGAGALRGIASTGAAGTTAAPRWRGTIGLAAAVALLLSAAVLVPASAATSTRRTTADSWVDAGRPNANNGGTMSLRVFEDTQVAYLKFKVPTLPVGEEVLSATLKLYAKTASNCSLGVEVLASSNKWGEGTITWNSQPGASGAVLARTTWTSKGYQSFDVSAAVSGAGPVSFIVRHAAGCNASNDVVFYSKEEGTRPPELVVNTGPGTSNPACSDGVDNDGDGKIDYPADLGCVDASDPDETDVATGTKTLVAAGDIVCSPLNADYAGANPAACQHRRTDDLLAGADAVAPLGDLQYPDGRLEYFQQAYDPTWGVHAPRSYPVPGNHEYHVAGAPGYFAYWASEGRPTGVAGNGYYSYDLGAWHVIALNSTRSCNLDPICAEGSPQNDWLETDLAATSKSCVLAYWHHPRFASAVTGGGTFSAGDLWTDLYAAGADVVLNGHEHNYQRFAKQTPAGKPASNGIRQFIVGAGGSNIDPLGTAPPNFEFGDDTHFGVLKLTLAGSSYSWRYLSVTGSVLDSGGPVPCN